MNNKQRILILAAMAGFLFKCVLPLCAAAILPASEAISKPAKHPFSATVGPINVNADGCLEIFGIGQNDSVWNNRQATPSAGWHSWNNMGQPDSNPGVAVARNHSGALEVFVNGGDSNVWHNWQNGPSGIWWGWKNMGGFGITSLSAAVNSDGRSQIFGVGTNSTLWSSWQMSPGGDWHDWTDLGGPGTRSGFVAAQNIDGCLELFAVEGDSDVWCKRQISCGGPWGDWTSLGSGAIHPRLAIARNSDGSLVLFGVRDSKIWQKIQTTPGGDQWGGWTDLGGPGIQPGFVVGMNSAARLEIFGVGKNGDVWHLWQNGDGSWNEWKDMGGPGSDPQLAVGNNPNGQFQVFALGQNGDIWSDTQAAPNHAWNGWNDIGGHGIKLFSGQIVRQMPHYASSLWQMGDGLPCNAVEALTQTSDGYLWVGTQKGLARFDGQQFVKMDSLFPDFPAQSVNTLCEGKNGELWIGIENGGLFCLTHGRLEHFQKSDGLSDNNVKMIYSAANSTVWIGTARGLSRFENGKFRTYSRAEGLAGNEIQSIVEDSDGLLWIGTTRGLNTIQNGSVTAVYTNLNERPDWYGVQNKSVMTLCRDGTGGLWLGTANGMIHRHEGDFRDHFRSDNFGLVDNFIAALYRDGKGVLWIGTSAGLNCWSEGKACITLLDNDGSGFDQINAICEDREGDIWVGGKEGLRRLRPRVFTTYGRQAGFTPENVMSVLEDKNDAMWVGIVGGGLNRFKDGNITTYSKGLALRTDLILSVCERRDGSIWFGADRDFGLYYLNQKTIKRYGADRGILDGPIRVIYEDRQTNLWIGAGKQLALLRDGNFSTYTTKDGLAGNIVQAIIEDHQGNLWFGTTTGLSRWADGKFANFSPRQGLSNDSINALYEDANRTLWIGTIGGGLNRYLDGKFRSYTTAQGLFSDDVLEILEDNQGCLWMSCFNGVFRVRKKSLDEFDHGLTKLIPCAFYGKADGMASSQCNGVAKPAGWKSADGKLWFATTKGLIVADPNAPFNDLPPPVMNEAVFADKQKIGADPLDTAKTPIRIKPGSGELEFHYTALSLQEPEKNRFKYKLNGYDTDWVDAGTRRVAYYNNLRPGAYRFQVMAANNNGVWNDTGASVDFSILPHIWQTWWFNCFSAAAGLFVIGGTARQITKNKMRRKLELLERQHAIERERTRIAEDMHDQLGANLTEIGLLTELTKRTSSNPKEIEPHLGKISERAREVSQTLDEIIWAVNPKNDNLPRLAAYIVHYAEEMCNAADIQCRLRVQKDLPEWPLSAEIRHNIFLAVREALNNLVRHSKASEASVHLSITDSTLEVLIEDNGRGFSVDTPDPCGNGLENMKKRIEAVAGHFELKTAPGCGTKIRVLVKIKNQ